MNSNNNNYYYYFKYGSTSQKIDREVACYVSFDK